MLASALRATALGLLLFSSAANAQGTLWSERPKLAAPPVSGLESGDRYGWRIALSGDTLIVLAPNANSNDGGVYVFTLNGSSWDYQTELQPVIPCCEPPRANLDVAIDGDTVVVGADEYFLPNGGYGAVYVFERNGSNWVQQARITPSIATDEFGQSVDIEGNTLVVGGRYGAWVFTRSGGVWTEQAQLTDPAGSDFYLGHDVALSGDRILVGSPNEGPLQEGAAHVFISNAGVWTHEARLTDANPKADSNFGWAVALDGTRALIGVPTPPGGPPPIPGPGKLVVFDHTGSSWVKTTNLAAPDGNYADSLGTSVALDGDLALGGAPGDNAQPNPGQPDSGAVYLFALGATDWHFRQRLDMYDAAGWEQLGTSLVIDGSRIASGAPYFTPPSSPGGGEAIYFWEDETVFGPCASCVNYCTAGTSASGCTALLTAHGEPSASAPEGFVLTALGVEGTKDGLFFFSANGRQAQPWGNGTSFQCVVPPVSRTALVPGFGAIGLCDGSSSADLNAAWTVKPNKNPGAGALLRAQFWYRDVFNTSNQPTSLSDALEATVGP